MRQFGGPILFSLDLEYGLYRGHFRARHVHVGANAGKALEVSYGGEVNFAFDPLTGYLLVASVPPEFNNDTDLRRFLSSGQKTGIAKPAS